MITAAKSTPAESITDAAIDVLNRAFAADPAAIHSLLCVRIPCNRAMADDPTVVVEQGHVGYTLDVMGLINGLLGELDRALVATRVDDEPDLDGTYRLLGFRRDRPYTYSPPRQPMTKSLFELLVEDDTAARAALDALEPDIARYVGPEVLLHLKAFAVRCEALLQARGGLRSLVYLDVGVGALLGDNTVVRLDEAGPPSMQDRSFPITGLEGAAGQPPSSPTFHV